MLQAVGCKIPVSWENSGACIRRLCICISHRERLGNLNGSALMRNTERPRDSETSVLVLSMQW